MTARLLTIYTHRTDVGRGAMASEVTPADILAGRGGRVGDYYVVEPGFKPQWTERESFENEWEKLASPKDKDMVDLGPVIDDARAQIDALAPASAPAPAKELLRDAAPDWDALLARVAALEDGLALAHLQEEEFLKDVSRTDTEAMEAANEILERLEQLEARAALLESPPAPLLSNAEVLDRITAIEISLEKLERALGILPEELEQLEPSTGSAAADETTSATDVDDTSTPRRSRGRSKS